MNKIRRLRYRKGFTLTELVVVVAVVAILMVCVAAFSQPIRAMAGSANAKSDALRVATIVGNYVENQLAFANSIDVFVGYELDNADLKKIYKDNYYDKYNTSADDNPRLLYFKYEKNTADELKSTYRIYDCDIKSRTDVSACISHGNKLFTDDFYLGYEYYFGMDEYIVKNNTTTGRAFLSFNTTAFDFDGEDREDPYRSGVKYNCMTSDFIKAHMQYVRRDKYTDYAITPPAAAPTASDPFVVCGDVKTAEQKTTFTLQNIKGGSSNVNIYYGSDSTDPPTFGSSDMVIMYNVKLY